MRVAACTAFCLLLVVPLVADAEYIEITLPEHGETYRPCAPTEITWDSDIDPGEGNVLEVSWHVSWDPSWNSLGLSSNDGVHPWPDSPCWTEFNVSPIPLDVKVQYTTDPLVQDIVEFDLFHWLIECNFSIFIDFSGTAGTYADIQRRIDPPMYEAYSAYVVILALADPGTPIGFEQLCFAIDCEFTQGNLPPSFTNLLPGDLSSGGWDDGVRLLSDECLGLQGGLVYAARLDFFYVGGQGDILIVDHPDYPGEVVDCSGQIHEYEVASHGGVWKEPASTATPVKAASWGSIKAMFRP